MKNRRYGRFEMEQDIQGYSKKRKLAAVKKNT